MSGHDWHLETHSNVYRRSHAWVCKKCQAVTVPDYSRPIRVKPAHNRKFYFYMRGVQVSTQKYSCEELMVANMMES